MTKSLMIILLVFLVVSCTDYGKVTEAHKRGNPHARELLLNGLTRKCSENIPSYIIDKALEGDEECKQIIYAQILIYKQTETHHSGMVFVPTYNLNGK